MKRREVWSAIVGFYEVVHWLFRGRWPSSQCERRRGGPVSRWWRLVPRRWRPKPKMPVRYQYGAITLSGFQAVMAAEYRSALTDVLNSSNMGLFGPTTEADREAWERRQAEREAERATQERAALELGILPERLWELAGQCDCGCYCHMTDDDY